MTEATDDHKGRTEHIFGRTVVNGLEYDAVLEIRKPNGRATSGLTCAEADGIGQVLSVGLDSMDLPEDFENKVESLANSLKRTKTVEECAEEVGKEEHARGGI